MISRQWNGRAMWSCVVRGAPSEGEEVRRALLATQNCFCLRRRGKSVNPWSRNPAWICNGGPSLSSIPAGKPKTKVQQHYTRYYALPQTGPTLESSDPSHLGRVGK